MRSCGIHMMAISKQMPKITNYPWYEFALTITTKPPMGHWVKQLNNKKKGIQNLTLAISYWLSHITSSVYHLDIYNLLSMRPHSQSSFSKKHCQWSLETKIRHGANFVITGGTWGYRAASDNKVGIITTLGLQWLSFPWSASRWPRCGQLVKHKHRQ